MFKSNRNLLSLTTILSTFVKGSDSVGYLKHSTMIPEIQDNGTLENSDEKVVYRTVTQIITFPLDSKEQVNTIVSQNSSDTFSSVSESIVDSLFNVSSPLTTVDESLRHNTILLENIKNDQEDSNSSIVSVNSQLYNSSEFIFTPAKTLEEVSSISAYALDGIVESTTKMNELVSTSTASKSEIDDPVSTTESSGFSRFVSSVISKILPSKDFSQPIQTEDLSIETNLKGTSKSDDHSSRNEANTNTSVLMPEIKVISSTEPLLINSDVASVAENIPILHVSPFGILATNTVMKSLNESSDHAELQSISPIENVTTVSTNKSILFNLTITDDTKDAFENISNKSPGFDAVRSVIDIPISSVNIPVISDDMHQETNDNSTPISINSELPREEANSRLDNSLFIPGEYTVTKFVTLISSKTETITKTEFVTSFVPNKKKPNSSSNLRTHPTVHIVVHDSEITEFNDCNSVPIQRRNLRSRNTVKKRSSSKKNKLLIKPKFVDEDTEDVFSPTFGSLVV